MSSLYILIPLSVVLVFVIGAIFWWSIRNGQYDDMEGPAYRMLLDDYDPPEEMQIMKNAAQQASAPQSASLQSNNPVENTEGEHALPVESREHPSS